MSDVSNSYRKEVRELLIKRIAAARQKFLDGQADAVEKAKQAAEQEPILVVLRAYQEKCCRLAEEKEAAEKRLNEANSETNDFCDAHGLSTYRYGYHKETFEQAVRKAAQRALEAMLMKDGDIGPKLEEFGRLESDLADMLTLALTQSRLRQVVDTFNQKLGLEPSAIEKEILGNKNE
jgi:transcription initiation factor TFIIIB Brf1 subunit/transcription initiation factor TFIIB